MLQALHSIAALLAKPLSGKTFCIATVSSRSKTQAYGALFTRMLALCLPWVHALQPPKSDSEDEVEKVDFLEGKTVEQLDALDEDDAFDDVRVLEEYRCVVLVCVCVYVCVGAWLALSMFACSKKRLAELKQQARLAKFGSVLPLERPDYVREVTEASNKCWVVLHMHQEQYVLPPAPCRRLPGLCVDAPLLVAPVLVASVEGSVALARIMAELAPRHPATKFMRIIATQCVENFPDSAVPTVLVYHDGDTQTKHTGLGDYGSRAIDINCT